MKEEGAPAENGKIFSPEISETSPSQLYQEILKY